VWWFEIFDCVRRLSLTGLLVFVFKGQASQVVVAMLLASMSVVAFVHLRPFIKDENENLAIVSQAAIFFTLFAALLKKMEVDKMDNYDKAMFGTVLIFVNCVGVTMVVGGWLVKPVGRLAKKLGDKHVHEAALKGVSDEHEEWSKFETYFKQLVESDKFMAAREPIHRKEWKVEGVVGACRCGNGDGPRDQIRVVFEVDHGLEEVYKYLTVFGFVDGNTLACHPMVDNGDGVLDAYLAAGMPWQLRARDFLFNRQAWLRGDEEMILSRSIESDDAGLKLSAQQGLAASVGLLAREGGREEDEDRARHGRRFEGRYDAGLDQQEGDGDENVRCC